MLGLTLSRWYLQYSRYEREVTEPPYPRCVSDIIFYTFLCCTELTEKGVYLTEVDGMNLFVIRRKYPCSSAPRHDDVWGGYVGKAVLILRFAIKWR